MSKCTITHWSSSILSVSARKCSAALPYAHQRNKLCRFRNVTIPMEEGSRSVRNMMKISLDSYISFVESDNKSDYKVDFINQILHFHGFKKIYKTPKKVLVEAVESIKMMHPTRLTLRQNISAGPFISHDKANSDLKSLDWLECSSCSVTSVQSLNVHDEALTSTELVVYEGNEDEPILLNRNSKRPIQTASPKQKKKANTKIFDAQPVGLGVFSLRMSQDD